jgi:hypothetical protein
VYVWRGLDAPRFELALVDMHEDGLRARGTQLGVEPDAYVLHYELETDEYFVTERVVVYAEGAGFKRTIELHRGSSPALEEALDVDLGYSPLYNSLPVLRHGLHGGGTPHDFVMAWIAVPELAVSRSEQRYEPLGDGLVRYRSDAFTADVEFDANGFVVRYPGLAERVGS